MQLLYRILLAAAVALCAPAFAQNVNDGFDPTANGSVLALAVQADGKIVIGGHFTQVGALTRNNVARLNPDGSVDSGFDQNVDGDVYALLQQANGDLVLGGNFAALVGMVRNHIARLHPDGSVDAGFDPNADSSVLALACDLYGGTITGYMPDGNNVTDEGTFPDVPQDDGFFRRFAVCGFDHCNEYAVQDGVAMVVTFFGICGMRIEYDADPIFHGGFDAASGWKNLAGRGLTTARW